MKKLSFILLLTIYTLSGDTQNLVSNYSFESFLNCPSNENQMYQAAPWFNASLATPDYYNECATSTAADVPNNIIGYQQAKTGVAYAGIVTYVDELWPAPCPNSNTYLWREYIEIQLDTSLTSGQEYCVLFYVSLPELCRYGIENVGAYFSQTAINFNDSINLPYQPQIVNTNGILTDTSGWTMIQGVYTAIGGEKYITIGNFDNDSNTIVTCFNPGIGIISLAYYYVDDIYVGIADSCPPDCIISLTMMSNPPGTGCDGDATATPSDGTPPYTYQWDTAANNQTTQIADSLCAGIYCVTVTDANNCTKDTCVSVPVSIIESSLNNHQITIHPNPTTGKFTVAGATAEIQIFDLFGRLLLRSNEEQIDMSGHPAGLYIWSVGSERGKLVVE